ncbi:MAG: pseudouridine synthase [Dysgonamonadaceae bacterium]|nr:pseudouridine synthase [Dysgonamonadaceae bacterium]MDD3728403.1 pseudouridine synthase [Dysgonamonadaceae bacterium]MDD4247117.1 pseudouridine synthase [Dysgonamonadaceae bacterium]
MKTNNEEKHNPNAEKTSGDRNDSSSKDNQERRITPNPKSQRPEQDSGRDRKGNPNQREGSSYADRDEQNRKRRPRVGDRPYSADNRNRIAGPNRRSSSDRYSSPDRSQRSERSDRYSSSDSYQSSERSDRYSSDRGNQQSGYSPRDRGGYSRGGGSKKVIKPLRKKKPFKQVKYKENADPTAPIRLNKYLANAGVCSRREADEFIQAGVVKVNGEVITELGTKIMRADEVTFHDKPIQLESKVYVLLNKPKGFVTTTDDPENRKTVMDLVRSACSERIYPVGRLDRGTTGVLLLTNDGDLASKLTHPRYEKRKIYQVWVDKPVAIEHMQAIADGVELEDGEILVDAISYVTEEDLTQIGIEIHSGKNRIVRRLFEKFGYRILRLDRVYFAGLTKKNLSRGRWRYLTEKEVNMLRMGAFD